MPIIPGSIIPMPIPDPGGPAIAHLQVDYTFTETAIAHSQLDCTCTMPAIAQSQDLSLHIHMAVDN